MPRRFGSDRSAFQNQSITLADTSGIPLIDTDNTFGASPLGNALREQTLFGLPNATFNLLPPDPASPISDYENGLPYWSLQTTDNITATAVYDTTAQTWGVKIDPGTAPSGEYLTLKTRAWVATDTNFALRQKASLTLAKNGTYAGATQWNLTLSAEYFSSANTSLGTTVIGTVFDNTTWTSISGTTTTGGSAIPGSASWVEFTAKLTTTATVSSSTSVTLQSLLVATSNPTTGSFVVVDTFTSSGTWTRPTGVTNLLAVIGIGGGGGGAGGQVRATDRPAITSGGQALVSVGGPSGGSSGLGLIQNIYVGNVDSISVGIGTAGAGGSGTTFTKAAAGTARVANVGLGYGTNGGAGGATTFGTMLTVGGGAGGTANFAGGPAAATPTATVYGIVTFAGVGGVAQGTAVGSASTTSTYSQIPYHPLPYVSGGAGGNGSGSGGTGTAAVGGAAGSAGILASSSAGGTASIGTAVSPAVGVGTVGAGGAGGGAGGGGGVARFGTGTVTILGTAGNGGTAADSTGVGGAGGGAVVASVDTAANYNASTITITSGNGAAGGKGVLYVFYVA